jgi:lactate racemase
MVHSVHYGTDYMEFSLPKGWHVISDQEKTMVSGRVDGSMEINEALDRPIGSDRIESIARAGMDVVVLFDDLQRSTPVHLALPLVLNRLNRAGVPDAHIRAVCASGTHVPASLDEMKLKMGREASCRLEGRLFAHDSRSPENVTIGRTHRGMLVEINPYVARADLIIGVGQCMAHPVAGFGGGFKIAIPGVSSHRSVADHHYTWMRHRNSRVNRREGNCFYEEIVDAGRLARLGFKIDLVVNDRREVLRAFAGDPVDAHQEASGYVASASAVPLPKPADVTIISSFPMDIGVQATKALTMASFCTRGGGAIIWVAPQREPGPVLPLLQEMATPETAGQFHRRLLRGNVPDHLNLLGISYIMQVVMFKEIAEKFRVFHVTRGLSPEMVSMMKFTYTHDIQEAVNRIAADMPQADVAIFRSGGNIIPEIHSP